MKIEYPSIQGVVHEAKYKIGDVVTHTNFGEEHTITRVLFAQGDFWYELGEGYEEPECTLEYKTYKK